MSLETVTFDRSDEPELVRLYFDRDESALLRTEERYGAYCYHVVYGILRDLRDAKECENDVYLELWNSMPPSVPSCFRTFLGKIARNLAIDRRRTRRGRDASDEFSLILDELGEVATADSPEQEVIYGELCESISAFLRDLPVEARVCFVQRYWYGLTVKEIAKVHNRSHAYVRMALSRIRRELREKLEQEGYHL